MLSAREKTYKYNALLSKYTLQNHAISFSNRDNAFFFSVELVWAKVRTEFSQIVLSLQW